MKEKKKKKKIFPILRMKTVPLVAARLVPRIYSTCIYSSSAMQHLHASSNLTFHQYDHHLMNEKFKAGHKNSIFFFFHLTDQKFKGGAKTVFSQIKGFYFRSLFQAPALLDRPASYIAPFRPLEFYSLVF